MSGIVIDVQSGAPKAEREVVSLSKALDNTVKSSVRAATSFSSFDTRALQRMQQQILNVQSQVLNLQAASRTANASVQNDVKQTGGAMEGLARKIALVTSAALAFKATNAFHGTADQLTNLNNRLALISKTSDEVIRRQRQVYEIARDTRTEMMGTADLMVNFTKSLEKAGIAGERVSKIVTTIQKSGSLSGSSVDALRGAIVQLNQGIASGTLRGEELNSVMEQMGYLGQGLQRTLGMNAGQLRKFAEEGRLTSEVLVNTLEKLAADTDRDFAKTAATSDQAAKRFGGAVKYMIGDVNRFYGITEGFAKRVINLADSVDRLNERFIPTVEGFRRGVRNFITEFSRMSALELTMKAGMTMEFDPRELYNRYRLYKRVKDTSAKLQSWLTGQKSAEFSVPMDFVYAGIDKLRDTMSIVKDTAATAFEAAGGLREVKKVGTAMIDALVVSWQEFVWILPKASIPVRRMTAQWSADFNSFFFDVQQGAIKGMLPFMRNLEGISEAVGGFGDNRLPRAVARMFQAKSIKDFRVALEDVNDAREGVRDDDWGLEFREAARWARSAVKPLTDLGISLGVLENRMLGLRLGEFFDRAASSMESWRRVAVRLYTDVLFPNIAPAVNRAYQNGVVYAKALTEGIAGTVNYANGYDLGESLARGIKRAVTGAAAALRSLFDISVDLTGAEGAGRSFGLAFMRGLGRLGSYFRGFFTGFSDEMLDGLSTDPLDAMWRHFANSNKGLFDGLADTWAKAASAASSAVSSVMSAGMGNSLRQQASEAADYMSKMFDRIVDVTRAGVSKVGTMIKDFATAVKREFFEIYDDVVGHSTWPDLIDGIVAYTDKIKPAESKLGAFAKKIKSMFRELYASVGNSPVGDMVREIADRFRAIDWGAALQTLKVNLGAALIATIAFAFGGLQMKIASAHFFLTMFNSVFADMMAVVAPALGSFAGEAVGRAGALIRESLASTLGQVSKAVIPFVTGFLGEFGGIVDGVMQVLGFIPNMVLNAFGSSDVLGGMALIGIAYGLIAKKGFETVSKVLFGEADKAGKKTSLGFFDAFMAATPMGMSKNGGFLKNLFVEKNLAVAAGVAFATSFFDGISLLQASVVGLPLLLGAIMGKDGINRIRQNVISGASTALGAGMDVMRGMVAKTAGTNSPLYQMIAGKPGKTSAAAVSRARGAAGDFVAAFSGSVEAFLSNRKAFGEGKIDFADMFKGKKDNLPDYFKYVVGQWQVGGVTLNKMGQTIRKQALDTVQAVSTVWQGQGAKAGMKSFADATVAYFQSGMLGLRSLTGFTLDSVLAMLKKYRGWIIALGGLLAATIAQAGTLGSIGFGDMASSFAESLTSITGIVVGLTALVALMKAAVTAGRAMQAATAAAWTTDMAGKAAAQAANNHKERMAQYAAELSARRMDDRASARSMANKKYYDAMDAGMAAGLGVDESNKRARKEAAEYLAARRRAFTDANRAEGVAFAATSAAQSRAEVKAAKDSALAGANIRGVGIDAVKQAMFDMLASVQKGFKNTKDFIKGIFNDPALTSKVFMDRVRDIGNFGGALRDLPSKSGAASNGLAMLAASLAALKAGQIVSSLLAAGKAMMYFGASALHAAGAGAALSKGGLGAFLRDLPKMAMAAARGLWTLTRAAWGAFAAVMAMLGIPAAIVGGVAAVGAIGVALFGPGNSLFDRVQWLYDKIRDIFGLQASTSGGREIILTQEFKTRTIGDETADFSRQLGWVDFGKLSEAQVTVLRDLAKTTKESFDNLEAEYIKNGKLTAEQTAEFRKLTVDTQNIIARQPAVGDRGFASRFAQGYQDNLYVDQSIGSQLRRLFGAIAQDAGGIEVDEDSEFADQLTLVWLKVKYTISDFVASLGPVQTALGYVNRAFSAVGEGINWVVNAFKGLGLRNQVLVASLLAVGSVLGAFLAPLAGVAAGFGLLVGAMAGLTTGGYLSNFLDWIDELGEKLRQRILGAPTEEQQARAREYAASNEKLLKYESFLPPEVKELIANADLEATSARKRADRLVSRGNNGLDFETSQEFQRAVMAAEVEAAQKEAFAKQIKKEYGDFGEQESKIKDFRKAMDELTASAKTYLDLDLGKVGDKFLGKQADYDRLRDLTEQARQTTFEISRATSPEGSRFLQTKLANLQAEAKKLAEDAVASMNFTVNLDLQAKTLGIDKEKLVDALMLDPSLFGKLQEYTAQIGELEVQIQKLGSYEGDPEAFVKIREQIAKTKLEVENLSKTRISFTDLQSGFNDMGVQGFDMTKMAKINRDALVGMGSDIDAYKAKQRELNFMAATGKPFEAQIAALKEMIGLVNSVNAKLKQSTADAVKQVMDGPGSNVAKLIQVSELTGDQVPDQVYRNQSLAGQYVGALSKKATAEAAVANARATGDVLSEADAQLYAQAKWATYKLNEKLSKLAEVRKVSIEAMIGAISGAGIEMDSQRFGLLPPGLQKQFAAVGIQIEAINNQLSEIGASQAGSPALTKLMARQRQLIEQAVKMASQITVFTGEQITSQMEEIGVQSLRTMSVQSLQQLMKMQAGLTALKAAAKRAYDTASTSDVAKYLEMVKQTSKATLDLRHQAEKLSRTFDQQMADVNEVFGTSLERVDFARFGKQAGDQLSAVALKLRQELEQALESGSASLPQILEKMDAMKLQGQFLSLMVEFRKGMREATVEGAQAGFNKVKEFMGDLNLGFTQYVGLGGDTRRQFSQQAAQLTALGKAFELPGLTQEMVDVLGGLSKGIAVPDVLKQFTDAFGSNAMATPLEQNTSAIQQLTAAITGKPVLGAEGQVTTSGAALPGTAASLSQQDYRGLWQAQADLRYNVGQAGIMSQGPLGQLVTMLQGLTAQGAVMAPQGTLGNVSTIWNAREMALKAIPGADPEQQMMFQAAVEFYNQKLASITEALNANAVKAAEAGKSFASAASQTMQSAFSDLLKGKANDGQSVFGTFATKLLDGFTSSVVDTMSSGILDGLFGGSMDKVMKQLGESLFSGFSGLFKGMDFSSLLSGLDFGKMFGGFSNMFSGLFSIFGFAEGGYVSGPGTGTSDSIPAKLSNGEFVVNAAATRRSLPLLHALNSGKSLMAFAEGGLVGQAPALQMPTRVSSYDLNQAAADRQKKGDTIVNLNVTGDISRQTKSEIFKMMPQIAAGVNSSNKENNYSG